MAKYRITGPDGSKYDITAPEGTSEQDVLSYAQQQLGASPKVAEAPPETSFLQDVAQGAGNLAAGAVRGAGSIGATILAPYDMAKDALAGKGLSLESNRERRAGMDGGLGELGAETDSFGYGAGKLAGEIAGTAGAGGVVANALSKIPGVAAAVPSLVSAVRTGGMTTGAPAATTIAGKAGDMAVRALGGAVSGGAQAGLVDPDQAGTGALIGGALPPAMAVAGKVGKAIGSAGRAVKAVAEPLYKGGREAIAGRTLRDAAGSSVDDVVTRLAGASEVVPGSMPTAAQTAESGGIAALERTMAAAKPEEFAKRGMDQAAARTQALRGIAGDDVARAAAVDARKSVTGDLYKQATAANYKMDQRLERLLQTPAMQQAMQRAKALAENNQRPFSFEVGNVDHLSGLGNRASNASRQITGQGLQDLKMAVDDMLKDPASGYAGAAGDAVKGLRGQLLNWMEDANPAFRAARTKYAELSKPVSQMDIGQELLTKLEPALNDYGGLARETGNKYALAMRNADQTARKATGFKGAGMADVMEPSQMQTLGAIAQDLARKANAQDLGRGVGSDTFQKFALSNIAQSSGAPRVVGAALNAPGVSKVANFLYSAPEQEIQTLIAKALLEPQTAAAMMRSAGAVKPPGLGNMLFANPVAQQLPYRVAPVMGGQ
jgi:hypothetical protein